MKIEMLRQNGNERFDHEWVGMAVGMIPFRWDGRATLRVISAHVES